MSDSPENNNQGSKAGKPAGDASADPLEAWRKLRDSTLEMWSKGMIEAVNSEAYSTMTGAMLDSCLTASAPFREAMSNSMLQALQQMNLPTRQDFESLADRMTNIEMRLDDLDAKLDAKLEERSRKQGGK